MLLRLGKEAAGLVAVYLMAIQIPLLSHPHLTRAQTIGVDSALTGTWVSKSGSVVTGSQFYNYKDDRIIEPDHTGISYSFTASGHYEVAYYRAVPNPGNPNCPEAVLQWQHGSYKKYDNGSLVLSPIEVDGRQLHSNPCRFKSSVYTRYNQSEVFKRYEVRLDTYHKLTRLNLFQFNGAPLMPLYRRSTTPLVLPTSTLHPLTSATGKVKGKSGGGNQKPKRGVGAEERGDEDDGKSSPYGFELDNDKDEHANRQKQFYRSVIAPMMKLDNLSWADTTWWVGVAMTSVGSVLYLWF